MSPSTPPGSHPFCARKRRNIIRPTTRTDVRKACERGSGGSAFLASRATAGSLGCWARRRACLLTASSTGASKLLELREEAPLERLLLQVLLEAFPFPMQDAQEEVAGHRVELACG